MFTYDDYFLDTPKYLFPDPKLLFLAQNFNFFIPIFKEEIKPVELRRLNLNVIRVQTCKKTEYRLRQTRKKNQNSEITAK